MHRVAILALFLGSLLQEGSISMAQLLIRSPPPAPNTTEVPVDCNIGAKEPLSRCLRLLLLDRRWDVVEKAEPLRLPDDVFDLPSNLELTNLQLGGLSCFNISSLQVTFPRESAISVDFALAWTDLVAIGDVRYRLPIIGWVSAKPILTVKRAVGRLQTTLNIDIDEAGRLTVAPTDTVVSFDLQDIDIPKIRLQSDTLSVINSIIGNPARSRAKSALLKLWRDNKDNYQKEAAEELDKLIVNNLAVHLEELLKPGKPSSSGSVVSSAQKMTRIRSGQECHRSITYGRQNFKFIFNPPGRGIFRTSPRG